MKTVCFVEKKKYRGSETTSFGSLCFIKIFIYLYPISRLACILFYFILLSFGREYFLVHFSFQRNAGVLHPISHLTWILFYFLGNFSSSILPARGMLESYIPFRIWLEYYFIFWGISPRPFYPPEECWSPTSHVEFDLYFILFYFILFYFFENFSSSILTSREMLEPYIPCRIWLVFYFIFSGIFPRPF